MGIGEGTFSSAISLSLNTSGGTYGLSTGDFNQDGRIDVVASDFSSSSLYILTGKGGFTSNALNTQQGARDVLGTLTGNLQRIEAPLGSLRATSSRLGTALNTLQSQRQTYLAVASRISDADIAKKRQIPQDNRSCSGLQQRFWGRQISNQRRPLNC